MEAPTCDLCGKDLPAPAPRTLRGRRLCPPCRDLRRGMLRRRAFLAGLLLALGLEGWLLAIVLGQRRPLRTSAASPAASSAERELREIRRDLEVWTAEQSRRLDEIASRPKTLSPEELAELRRSMESLHAAQRSLEERLKEPREAPTVEKPPAAPPLPSAESPGPAAPPAVDPATEETAVRRLAGLQSGDPRARHEALMSIAEGALPDAAVETERLLADPYSFVRREAASALGRLHRAEAVPALLSRLEAEEDPVARQRVLSALGRITGLPYDPRTHRGAALIDRIQSWRDWKK